MMSDVNLIATENASTLLWTLLSEFIASQTRALHKYSKPLALCS